MKNTPPLRKASIFYVVKSASSYTVTRYQFQRVFRLPLYPDNEGTKIVRNVGQVFASRHSRRMEFSEVGLKHVQMRHEQETVSDGKCPCTCVAIDSQYLNAF